MAMLKITLKLYPTEWRALVGLCPKYDIVMVVGTKTSDVRSIILAEFRSKLSPDQIIRWHTRRDNNEFSYKIPLSVARSLWDYMQGQPLSTIEQLLLYKLDKAITNFTLPTL